MTAPQRPSSADIYVIALDVLTTALAAGREGAPMAAREAMSELDDETGRRVACVLAQLCVFDVPRAVRRGSMMPAPVSRVLDQLKVEVTWAASE